MRPLADEIRPQTLDDVAGQKHLLGEGALLRRLIENGTDANLIFYGPSGTGKTTVANIIAKQAKKALYTGIFRQRKEQMARLAFEEELGSQCYLLEQQQPQQ